MKSNNKSLEDDFREFFRIPSYELKRCPLAPDNRYETK